jgi:hypothetical protein
MTEPKIPRLKDPANYTPADYLQIQQTGEKPLNPAWLVKRAELLEDADLESEETSSTDERGVTSDTYLKKINKGESLS